MSSSPIQSQSPQVQSLNLFPNRAEDILMMMQQDTTPPNTTRTDVTPLQPVQSAENINLIATTGPLRRTLSVFPSTPEDWDNHVHLDLSHESNADLTGKRKRTSSL